MSTSILLVTQSKVGKSLLKAAETTYKTLPAPVKAFCVGCEGDPDTLIPKLENTVEAMDHGDGVLVLTDLFGSTASNIAHKLKEISPEQVKVLSGLNLPMLLKTLNYADLPLDELTQKAIEGGKEGIRSCDDTDQEKNK